MRRDARAARGRAARGDVLAHVLRHALGELGTAGARLALLGSLGGGVSLARFDVRDRAMPFMRYE